MLKQFRRQTNGGSSDESVGWLLAAAAAPTEPGPVPGEAEALAAFRASQTAPRRSLVLTYLVSFKTAIATALGAGVLLTAGVGAAAAGSLPGAAQDTASQLLAKVGVTVPGADAHSAGHADGRGASDDAAEAPATPSKGEKGAAVSEIAKDPDLTGVEKGAAVSDRASDGKSQAGEHGKAEERGSTARDDDGAASSEQAKPAEAEKDHAAPVETSHEGGTGTAEVATKGDTASSEGTDTKDEATSGTGAEGSADRP